MEFDKSRVYTALNADKLKVGSKVIVADTLGSLKSRVEAGECEFTLCKIEHEFFEYRFHVDNGLGEDMFALAYLVSEPEENKLMWTDLKVGDVITDGEMECMVVTIDKSPDAVFRICVICSGNSDWLDDDNLKNWKKVDK